MTKVFVLGIDGAPPEYIFGEWLEELPNIKKLMGEGCWAKLNSTIPPLSAVAWASMTTGKSSSDTGIFEYVYRKNKLESYENKGIISSINVKEKTVWQIASEHNKKSIICLVPLTWPIEPFNGILISGYMTPNTKSEYVYPKEFKKEMGGLFEKEFRINSEYRGVSKQELIKDCHKITEMHFKLIRYLLEKKEWDLFFGVIIESDAINHNFLRYCDKAHRKYEPDSEFKNSMKNYYRYIDEEIGKTLKLLDKDTRIIVLSDHGMVRMHNRVNLSDWLIREGYLILKEQVKEKIKLDLSDIDWNKTKVWAIGAYEGQIFINLQNREPNGIVKKEEYENLIKDLEEKLKKITGDDGAKLDTKVFVKKRDYHGKKIEDAPDIIVYFDDLKYGCNTSLIGNKTLWSPQTAKGSDDSGHSRQGIFIEKGERRGFIGEIDILDIAPTILKELGIAVPKDMKGKVLN